jgi:hypothetical protein
MVKRLTKLKTVQFCHVALRGRHVPNPPQGEAISSQVAAELLRVCMFAEKVQIWCTTGF